MLIPRRCPHDDLCKDLCQKNADERFILQTVGILPILILIVAVFGFIAPNFFTESNLLNITRQASINIVLRRG